MCSIVYGLHTVETRRDLWHTLRAIGSQATPRIIAGDFHSILSCEDRVNGAPVSHHETRDFVDCMDDLALTELKSIGPYYSWSNKGVGDARIASRIDRGLVNGPWMLTLPNVAAQYLSPSLSDHSPIL